jgi:hypothetical protein
MLGFLLFKYIYTFFWHLKKAGIHFYFWDEARKKKRFFYEVQKSAIEAFSITNV